MCVYVYVYVWGGSKKADVEGCMTCMTCSWSENERVTWVRGYGGYTTCAIYVAL